MDELLRDLRNYLADAPKREKAAEARHKELLGAFAAMTTAISDGFTLISHSIIDMSRERARH
jgi:hypothetical protein